MTKLEKDAEDSLDSARGRASFTRRCADLKKQLREQLGRLEALKPDAKTADFDERKRGAVEKVRDFEVTLAEAYPSRVQRRVDRLVNEESEERPEEKEEEEGDDVFEEGEGGEDDDMFRQGSELTIFLSSIRDFANCLMLWTPNLVNSAYTCSCSGHLSPDPTPQPVAAPRLAARRPSMYDNPDPDEEDTDEDKSKSSQRSEETGKVEVSTAVPAVQPEVVTQTSESISRRQSGPQRLWQLQRRRSRRSKYCDKRRRLRSHHPKYRRELPSLSQPHPHSHG